MYVCLCKAITKNQLEEVYSRCGGSVKQTLTELGVGSDCGTCLEKALDAMDLKPENAKTIPKVKTKSS